jgi:hypothetical protein
MVVWDLGRLTAVKWWRTAFLSSVGGRLIPVPAVTHALSEDMTMRGLITSIVSSITAAALLVVLSAVLMPVAAQEGERATQTITIEHSGEPSFQGIKVSPIDTKVVKGDRLRVLIKSDVWCPADPHTPSNRGEIKITVKPDDNDKIPSCGFTSASTRLWRTDLFGKNHYRVLGGYANGVADCTTWVVVEYIDDNCTASEYTKNMGVSRVKID